MLPTHFTSWNLRNQKICETNKKGLELNYAIQNLYDNLPSHAEITSHLEISRQQRSNKRRA